MKYKEKDIKHYLEMNDVELIPLHTWNKQINGDPRGKTPIDRQWNTVEYSKNQYKKWIEAGLNVGYRIKENELIVDLDPRNYDKNIDSEQRVADLFGYDSFDDLLWHLTSVKTGAGGYHIYTTLPPNVDHKNLKKCVETLPGVDFKKKGGYVVAAGSRHPNGEHYKWENVGEIPLLPTKLVELLTRQQFESSTYTSGYGAFNGTQLQELILDKLDISNYNTNDKWEPILMASHHATAGDGLEEFLQWSCGDENYSQDENKIRLRWESLVTDKSVSRTVGSLIHELKIRGADTSSAKAILDFSAVQNVEIKIDEYDDDSEIMQIAKKAGDEIDVSDVLKVPRESVGLDGAAITAAKQLKKTSTMEDKMTCIRLIKAASLEESIEAQEILIDAKVMSQSSINKRLKALDDNIIDSVTEILANTTINSVFNEGKHVMVEPSKQLWVYKKTHWIPIADEFLGKVVYRVLDTLKTKMDISTSEVNLVTAAVRAIRMRSSNESPRLFSGDHILPIINCKNGEIWINKDGTHILKPHNYRSYQIKVLNTEYDPSAKCELFDTTIREIFENFDDGDEMVRHMSEILGYTIQPYKPAANWWMFRGSGGDGKSTILKILNAILGDSLYSAGQTLLSVESARGNNHESANLVGKLAITIEELEENSSLNDVGLKMLSENTKMSANPKNRDMFSFNYVGSLIMCCNAFPIIKGTTEGTLRRANIIPFNRQFVKCGQADDNRAQRIVRDKSELAGVLNFMLEGYQRYVTRGRFDPPKSCIAAKEEWLCNANNVVRFVRDNINMSDDSKIKLGSATDVYTRYCAWCVDEGTRTLGRNKFYLSLDNLGIKKRIGHNKTLYFYGAEFFEFDIDDFDDFDDFDL